MNKAEDNYQIIRQLQDGRDFLLTMLEQNPSLLKTAEPRIKELFEYGKGENVVHGGKQRGISLIELILFIVIISVALTGILLVMNQTTAHSADPLIRKQALAIAESILEEVELMPFTYCDPDDPVAGLDTTMDTTPCTVPAGGEDAAMGAEVGETRYSTTTPFDNVSDYHGFGMASGSIMDITNSDTGLNGYTLQAVTVAPIAMSGIAANDALLITVTVSNPSGADIVLEGVRTRYAPRTLP